MSNGLLMTMSSIAKQAAQRAIEFEDAEFNPPNRPGESENKYDVER
jgi:hypothetical protein